MIKRLEFPLESTFTEARRLRQALNALNELVSHWENRTSTDEERAQFDSLNAEVRRLESSLACDVMLAVEARRS